MGLFFFGIINTQKLLKKIKINLQITSTLIVDSFDPFLAKVMSCRETLNWLKILGFSKVIIEIDVLNVYNARVKYNIDLFYAGLS